VLVYLRRSHCITHIVDRRQNAEEGERPGAQHLFSIHKNLELTVTTGYGLDVDIQILAQGGRRTGGLYAGDSVAAPLNRH